MNNKYYWIIFFIFILVKNLQGGAAFFAWRRYAEGALTNFIPSYEQDFNSGVQAGPDYGYGGDSSVGAVGKLYWLNFKVF